MSNANPLQRLQPHWDWRAAGNFICGGAGAGLVAFTSLHAMDLPAAPYLLAAGLALVGLGLFCVWLEIGRPWRAVNVFVHLRSSWMSREALAAVALFALGGGLVAGMHWRAWPTALAALVFLYCQARILVAARGIPAWRDTATGVLLVVTGLAEGVGLFWAASAWSFKGALPAVALAVLLLARAVAWEAWRARVGPQASPRAVRWLKELETPARWLGAALPLALLGLGLALASPLLVAVAGAIAVLTGATFKYVLVTRLSFHHGYSIPRMPVRGAPRVAMR